MRIVYDIANAHFIGEDFADGLRQCRERLALVHLSDTEPSLSSRSGRPRHGAVRPSTARAGRCRLPGAADDVDRYTRMADAVIAEFAKPTDAMIDAAYEAVRFDEAWSINLRRDFVKGVKAMVQTALGKCT